MNNIYFRNKYLKGVMITAIISTVSVSALCVMAIWHLTHYVGSYDFRSDTILVAYIWCRIFQWTTVIGFICASCAAISFIAMRRKTSAKTKTPMLHLSSCIVMLLMIVLLYWQNILCVPLNDIHPEAGFPITNHMISCIVSEGSSSPRIFYHEHLLYDLFICTIITVLTGYLVEKISSFKTKM